MKTKHLQNYCNYNFFQALLISTAISLTLFSCSQKSAETQEQATTSSQKNEENDEDKTNDGDNKVILFFGNSLTAGYGLEPEEAYPALIQKKLDSLGYDYQVVNAGLSGETTASGNSRLEWVLERQKVDIFVLELGANDGLRGIPTEETDKNLRAMINKVREVNSDIQIILAGMMVPPNMGPEYAARFQKLYPSIAEQENVKLIPFLLENVAGEKELNQSDGIHPTAEGQRIVANNVWPLLLQAIEQNTNS
ncbi:arylesterase [Porifericola rhodea]|uniref:arylesterase n=1 Tax=Porifericola rhodea TaxID=930972 RepID=UPI0026660DD7|nr:arylesterase [Porifericola rhodea]WKN30225.1 arylesterase [Porifericola rhodea]